MVGAVIKIAGLVLALAAPPASAATTWDIANTGAPGADASFTVTEGTWMSVDVSPDGRKLVAGGEDGLAGLDGGSVDRVSVPDCVFLEESLSFRQGPRPALRGGPRDRSGAA